MADIEGCRLISPSGRVSGTLKVLSTTCVYLENALLSIAGIMIIASMIITCVDVVMRYVFSSPMGWIFDFITLYLLPGSYFLAFSYALRNGSHLKVDYFRNKIPFMVSHPLLSFFGVVAGILFSYISYIYFIESYHSWRDGDVLSGIIPWPMWPSDLIVAVSCLVFSFRLFISVIEKIIFLRSDLS